MLRQNDADNIRFVENEKDTSKMQCNDMTVLKLNRTKICQMREKKVIRTDWKTNRFIFK